jgi:hypothetical protein
LAGGDRGRSRDTAHRAAPQQPLQVPRLERFEHGRRRGSLLLPMLGEQLLPGDAPMRGQALATATEAVQQRLRGDVDVFAQPRVVAPRQVFAQRWQQQTRREPGAFEIHAGADLALAGDCGAGQPHRKTPRLSTRVAGTGRSGRSSLG